ncbi:MAG TPA: hypothetical protein DCZ43_08155 [candidate division Zixibacteria bacterium]|nr:hypothetical protein [candidate division Zixibacteria bacterium]
MKTFVILVLLCILPAALLAADSNVASYPDGSRYYADRFIVTTHAGVPALELGKVSGGKAISGVSSIDYLCVEQNVTEIEPWYQGIVKNQGLHELVSRMYIFHLAPGQDAFLARDAFRTCSDVELADAYDIPVLFYTPNDPQRTSQWHLTKIHAYDAWDIFRGDTTRTAIIGIVDTGIYYTHPDLASNMWINDQEDLNHNGIKDAGDINGEDDDANGYIDDVIGWDFGRNDNDPREEAPIHATHVAGCASECTDNNLNGAGIGFKARVMAVKGARYDTLYAVYQGLTYAAENGAQILNCSWGSSQYNASNQNLINGLWNNYGVVIVAAAGNNGTSQIVYPGGYNNVLSVAATNSGDQKASFSSYGTWVDVSAPGASIYSTWGATGMDYLDGTSMASPITAGIAALLRAAHPSWTNQNIVDAIVSTTDNINAQNPSYIGMLGSGRVNAFNALGSATIPRINVDTSMITVTNDDGDGKLNPGESFSLFLVLENIWEDANNVNVTVTSTAFDFSDSTASFGTIVRGGLDTNTTDPLLGTAHINLAPGLQQVIVHITADSTYSNYDTVMIAVSMDQIGFPMDIPGNIESSPIIFDFDQDGDNELLFGADDNNVYALEANGSNSPGWPKSVTGNPVTGPAIGDIDHNGSNEVVEVTKDGKFYAWHANGEPVTGFPVTKGGIFNSGALLADINGDQNLEIIAGSFSDFKVYAVKSDGTDLANWPTRAYRNWNASASAADIDEDGLEEIVYAGFDSALHVWNADTTEVTGFPVRQLGGQIYCSPTIGDVDGDHHLDIVVSTYNAPAKVYLINHLGQVAAGFPVSYTGVSIRSTPSLVDLNSDSTLEIVFGTSDGNLRVLKSDGTELAGFPRSIGGNVFGTPVVGDITGDHLPDIIVGNTAGNLFGFDRTGTTLPNFPIMGTSSRQITGTVALGDLDRDGRMEIAVPIKATGSNLMVYDYRVAAQVGDLKWPNFGRDEYRRNNTQAILLDVDEHNSMPTSFGLFQNYPNPFNASTTIRFALNKDGAATLSVFDILGRRVKLLQSGALPAGEHSITWNGVDESGTNVTSGIYFYRLESDGRSIVKRMIMLK